MDHAIEGWPYRDEGMLLQTLSRKVCITCHCFRHESGVNGSPLVTHLCQGWTDDMTRSHGWAPEAG
ncbi:hypothetical protein KBY96_15965 [Cyanobium sp. ATX 6A2]|nr:hypothetical protein [Cyanobium sp. ATX 6A2]